MAASRKKFSSEEECLAFIDTLSIANIRAWLKDFLMEEQPEKITVTEEQLAAFFKVRGIANDGSVERRGRPRKEK